MKQKIRALIRPDLAGSYLLRRDTWTSLEGKRKRLLAGLSLLAALLIVLTWIGLARQAQGGPHVALATTSSRQQVEPPRRDASLAYDPAQQIILLFGGTLLTSGGTQTNETWTWNGQTWKQLHPTTSPPPLQGTMVYDTSTRQIILFLNQLQSGGTIANQMWMWDGSSWHQLQSSLMPEVVNASIAYDATRNQIVLFGGEVADAHADKLTNATWTWNGLSWQEQHPTISPSPRAGAAIAYDAARQETVLYGGITQKGLSAETWTWNGLSWQLRQQTSLPPMRQNARLVYDNATRQALLFGGINAEGTQPSPADTWAWNGDNWSKLSSQGAPTNLYASAAYDSATQTVVVYAVQDSTDKLVQTSASASPVSQTWAWDGTRWKLLL